MALFENDEATVVNDLPTAPITDIYTTNVDGAIDGDTTFVGVHNRGVFRFDGAAWVPLATENPQPSGHIESILMDEMGTLWLGGADGGLVRIKNDN